jgi:hypothetical protein
MMMLQQHQQQKKNHFLLCVLMTVCCSMVVTVQAQQYTYKCGNQIYICGKAIKKETMCVPGNAVKTIVPGTAAQCKAMTQAMKAAKLEIFKTKKYKCPNGQNMNQYVQYNSLGKNGNKCEKQGCAKCKGAHCGGDPHFLTYEGTGYSYHGQCDLVMAHSDNINDSGLSLDVHARTAIIADWSYISNASIRIGNDILEVTSKGEHYVNGVANTDEASFYLGGKYMVNRTVKEAFPGLFRTDFIIDLQVKGLANDDSNDVIRISAFKDLLSVNVDAMLPDTYGMLGIHGRAGLYGRDLKTKINENNPNKMGQEWQVRDNEPKLFRDKNHVPQYPAKCMLPITKTTTAAERRLRAASPEQMERKRIAQQACANIQDDSMRGFCEHDVMLTGDTDIVLMYEG